MAHVALFLRYYREARKHNLTLVSFDRDFDTADLARKTPADILRMHG